MKFEHYFLQLKLFQMRPITIFYGKPFFRFKKKTHRTLQWMMTLYIITQQHWNSAALLIESIRKQNIMWNMNLTHS